jgi:hypothetical protein
MPTSTASRRLFAVARSHEVAQIEEACAAIGRMPEPLARVVSLAISGTNWGHIATATGLSETRIEQVLLAMVKLIESEQGSTLNDVQHSRASDHDDGPRPKEDR